ncbi:MAG TPA: hypothetical protein VGM31_05755, partial [Puia sp.]
MTNIIDDIRKKFEIYDPSPITGLDKIPQSGSNRMYFRIRTVEKSYIATYNDNIRENRTFIYFSRHFRSRGCPVPEIYWVSDDYMIYIQQD